MIFQACSSGSVGKSTNSKEISKSENYKRAYSAHLSFAINQLIAINPRQIVQLPKTGTGAYLDKVVSAVISQNELHFSKLPEIKFYTLNIDGPVYFSLPGGEIFFSRGLLKKYLKNEELFISLVVFELLKINHSAFIKRELYPTGNYELSNFIDINRITSLEKIEIYKWSYYVLKRSGFNPNSILNFIQLQNRNSLDFVVLTGNLQDFSKEEFAVKSFLVSQGLDNKNIKIRNSTPEFYKFVNNIVNIK